MPIWYQFHCDETNVHNRPEFAIGGIRVTPNRYVAFEDRLNTFKANRGINHELKWNKVNHRFLSLYKEFVTQLVEESSPTCFILRVTKGIRWSEFGRNEEERFFKCYYTFFNMFASSSYRHSLFLDYKSSKWYRWQSLQFALNGKARRDYLTKINHIARVEPVNSKDDVVIQLADIMLGGMVYTGNDNTAKGCLSQFIKSLSEKRTKYGSKLVVISNFQPFASNQ